MNYLQKNSRGKGSSRQILLTFAIIVLTGVFYFFAPIFLNDTVFSVARPVWNAKNYVVEQFAKFFSSIADKENLTEFNNALKQELEEARIALRSLDLYKSENHSLKAMLGRGKIEKRVLGNIMAKPNHSLYDTLLLDAGEQVGVAVGDRVLAGDFVLGTIREVYANHSKATLISAPGEILRVLIGESNIAAEALGRGAGNFIVKIPKEIENCVNLRKFDCDWDEITNIPLFLNKFKNFDYINKKQFLQNL